MDKMTVNMIAGATLSALLVIFGTSTLINIAYPTGGAPQPAEEGAGAGGAGAPAEAAAPKVPFNTLLAKADVKVGENATKACHACHTFEQGGPNKIGPNLYGVVGRPVASHPGFAYSAALKKFGGNWTYDKLNCFIDNPRGCVSGTKMTFAGIKKDPERADVVAYLHSISPDAPPLPAAEARAPANAAGGQPAKAAPAGPAASGGKPGAGATSGGAANASFDTLLAKADPKVGENATRICHTCHTFEKGGPNKIGPNLYGVVGRPVASHEGFAYSEALKKFGGNWTYDKLNCFIQNPKGCVAGTKMAYAGMKKDSERADIIAYLHSISPAAPPLPSAANTAPANTGGQNDGKKTETGSSSHGDAKSEAEASANPNGNPAPAAAPKQN